MFETGPAQSLLSDPSWDFAIFGNFLGNENVSQKLNFEVNNSFLLKSFIKRHTFL